MKNIIFLFLIIISCYTPYPNEEIIRNDVLIPTVIPTIQLTPTPTATPTLTITPSPTQSICNCLYGTWLKKNLDGTSNKYIFNNTNTGSYEFYKNGSTDVVFGSWSIYEDIIRLHEDGEQSITKAIKCLGDKMLLDGYEYLRVIE